MRMRKLSELEKRQIKNAVFAEEMARMEERVHKAEMRENEIYKVASDAIRAGKKKVAGEIITADGRASIMIVPIPEGVRELEKDFHYWGRRLKKALGQL